jgi:hypothetical protein
VGGEHLLSPPNEPGDFLHEFGFETVHCAADSDFGPTELMRRTNETIFAAPRCDSDSPTRVNHSR